MALDQQQVRAMAADYTAAWNSGSPEAVASFYAAEGRDGWPCSSPFSRHERIRNRESCA